MRDALPAARQLALPFVHRPRLAPEAFVRTAGNADALAWLAPEAEDRWPRRRLALWGGPGSGKTHLLHLWTARLRARGRDAGLIDGVGADRIEPAAELPARDALAIDDIDLSPNGEALLHLLNRAEAAGVAVLLASRTAPARIAPGLADLASRLAAMLAVRLGERGDEFLDALLARLLADRQIAVPEPVARYLRLNLPRDPGAIRDAVARLDRLLLETRGPPTQALCARVVAELDAGEDAQGAALHPQGDGRPLDP